MTSTTTPATPDDWDTTSSSLIPSLPTRKPFYFTRDQVKLWSRKSSVSISDEKECRVSSICMIRRICGKLRYPWNTAATAIRLYHRFFAIESLANYYDKQNKSDSKIADVYLTCVHMASKMEETVKKAREAINAYYYFLNQNPKTKRSILPSDVDSQKKRMMEIERVLGESIGYCFDSIQLHPHPMVITFTKTLFGQDSAKSLKTALTAWNLVEDCYFTNLCLIYPPNVLALCFVLIASEVHGLPHPPSNVDLSLEWLPDYQMKSAWLTDCFQYIQEVYHLEPELDKLFPSKNSTVRHICEKWIIYLENIKIALKENQNVLYGRSPADSPYTGSPQYPPSSTRASFVEAKQSSLAGNNKSVDTIRKLSPLVTAPSTSPGCTKNTATNGHLASSHEDVLRSPGKTSQTTLPPSRLRATTPPSSGSMPAITTSKLDQQANCGATYQHDMHPGSSRPKYQPPPMNSSKRKASDYDQLDRDTFRDRASDDQWTGKSHVHDRASSSRREGGWRREEDEYSGGRRDSTRDRYHSGRSEVRYSDSGSRRPRDPYDEVDRREAFIEDDYRPRSSGARRELRGYHHEVDYRDDFEDFDFRDRRYSSRRYDSRRPGDYDYHRENGSRRHRDERDYYERDNKDREYERRDRRREDEREDQHGPPPPKKSCLSKSTSVR